MRSRALLTMVLLSTAVVSGGWLVRRGLVGGRSTLANKRLFDEVYRHVSNEFVDTLSDSALDRRAADGLVQELNDPHSAYLSADVLRTFDERTSGHYAGVGARIDVRNGRITIVSTLPGGPALDAGVQPGDQVTAVDGRPVVALKLEEARKLLRGAPGSVVRLTIERAGVAAPLDIALTRRDIRVHSVQHAMLLRPGLGYVALAVFSEESASELRRAVDSLTAQGPLSLILDLRGDPGGLLEQGVGVSELFLDPGQRIVSMRGRLPAASESFDDRLPQPWPRLPLTILVDSNTASAAEIVAGALQDHDRALIVGAPTYGKGSAQSIFKLNNGAAVKLTTALWFTPSGRTIDRKRGSDGSAVPDVDSVRTRRARYVTDAGRSVLGGGGITPDVILPADRISPGDTAFERSLGTTFPQFRDALTEYALQLKASGTIASPAFAVTPAMRAELLRRMQARGISTDRATFERAATLIDRVIGYEVARYVFGEPAEYARRLHDDAALARTISIVSGATTQRELLARATKR